MKPRDVSEVTLFDFGDDILPVSQQSRIQVEAVNTWIQHSCMGTLEMATGSGKTRCALLALQTLYREDENVTATIIVPQVSLAEQWRNRVSTYTSIDADDIGIIGGGWSEWRKPVKIGVVNSVRGHEIVDDITIADEIHRYGSEENRKVLRDCTSQFKLGLTATFERPDGEHDWFHTYNFPRVYTYSQEQAIEDGVLQQFELINVHTRVDSDYTETLEGLDEFISSVMETFGYDFNAVQNAASNDWGKRGERARQFFKATQKRKKLLQTGKHRRDVTVQLAKNCTGKMLVFGAFQDFIDNVYDTLTEERGNVWRTHSGLSRDVRDTALEEFRVCDDGVLLSVKSLDEGVDVPLCNEAVIAGGNSIKGTMVQRLGRVLRTGGESDVATVYQLFTPGTKETDWVKSRTDGLRSNAERTRLVDGDDILKGKI